jgi:calcium/calmodulin-dependent protein kinase I
MGGCLAKEEKKPVENNVKKEEPATKTTTNATTTTTTTSPTKSLRLSIRKSLGLDTKTEVTHRSGAVDAKYEIGKELGRGGFSVVKEGVDRATGEKVAIKFIEKKFVDQEELKLLGREIDIMKKVQHRNVLRLIEIYETDNHLSLVMELVNGGELFYKIVDKGSYSEREARDIIRQLVEGVDYLHSKGIAHRDLKPENLLCSENEEGVVIKIADFGLSKAFSNGSVLETSCGTPDYAAPEVLRMDGAYDKSVDLWSMGVITYVVLCGFPPFYGKTQAHLFEKILNAEYDFPDPEWTNISEEAKDFIRHLLVLDIDKRYTTKQCLDHPWLKMGTVGLEGNINVANKDYMKLYEQKRKGH